MKTGVPGEKPLEAENQQQTQPTHDAGSGNRTRDTLVGSERSRHCANPAPQNEFNLDCDYKYTLLGSLLTSLARKPSHGEYYYGSRTTIKRLLVRGQ